MSHTAHRRISLWGIAIGKLGNWDDYSSSNWEGLLSEHCCFGILCTAIPCTKNVLLTNFTIDTLSLLSVHDVISNENECWQAVALDKEGADSYSMPKTEIYPLLFGSDSPKVHLCQIN